MRLIEADGKELLHRAGLPVAGNTRLIRPGQTPDFHAPCVLKAQILSGGRGNAGLVKLVDAVDAPQALAAMRAALVRMGEEPLVLVEDRVAFDREYYMGWRIDDVAQKAVLMFSLQGGVDIESHADSVTQWPVDPLKRLEPHELIPFFVRAGVAGKMLGALSRFAADLYRVFRAEDALLLEINPLAVTPQGGLVALDCKTTVDEAAFGRHTYWRDCASYQLRHSGMTPAEAAGADAGVTYVELSGDIALLSSGAGLGMALVDLLADAGFKAANFCDIIGGSGISAFTSIADLVFDRAERSDVRAIAAFFTLSATSLKPAVGALIDVIRRRPPSKPLVIGFAATGAAVREMSVVEAREEFAKFGYPCVTDPADLIDALRAKLA